MFCLRSWLGLLLFLTNASPIYVLLFLTGTYILQRPCVYCSILLLVLICSLFDFGADWFEPRFSSNAIGSPEAASSFLSGNSTLTEVLVETAGMAVTAINGTGGSLASAAIEVVKRKVTGQGNSVVNGNAGGGAEWVRAFLDRKQFRIPCLDVVVRL